MHTYSETPIHVIANWEDHIRDEAAKRKIQRKASASLQVYASYQFDETLCPECGGAMCGQH